MKLVRKSVDLVMIEALISEMLEIKKEVRLVCCPVVAKIIGELADREDVLIVDMEDCPNYVAQHLGLDDCPLAAHCNRRETTKSKKD